MLEGDVSRSPCSVAGSFSSVIEGGSAASGPRPSMVRKKALPRVARVSSVLPRASASSTPRIRTEAAAVAGSMPPNPPGAA